MLLGQGISSIYLGWQPLYLLFDFRQSFLPISILPDSLSKIRKFSFFNNSLRIRIITALKNGDLTWSGTEFTLTRPAVLCDELVYSCLLKWLSTFVQHKSGLSSSLGLFQVYMYLQGHLLTCSTNKCTQSKSINWHKFFPRMKLHSSRRSLASLDQLMMLLLSL